MQLLVQPLKRSIHPTDSKKKSEHDSNCYNYTDLYMVTVKAPTLEHRMKHGMEALNRKFSQYLVHCITIGTDASE